jgi:hypothetical protein
MIADADEAAAEEDSSLELGPTALGAMIVDADHGKVDPHARTNLEMQAPNLNGVRVSPPVPAGSRPQSVPPLPQQPTAMQAAQPEPPHQPGPVTIAQSLHPMPARRRRSRSCRRTSATR